MSSIRAALTVAVALLALGACGQDADSPGTEPESGGSATTDSPDPTNSTPASMSDKNAADLPIPPGASSWPVRDVASCQDLEAITEPEVIARIPVATAECVIFPESNKLLVISTWKVDFDTGGGRALTIPGFRGSVRAIMEQMSRGVVHVVEPVDTDAKYLVLWDGDTNAPVDALIADLFVQR